MAIDDPRASTDPVVASTACAGSVGARLTFGSLFAGIGGLDLGLERAGMTCAWQVECDPFARRVLEKHWPEVPRHVDVRRVGATELRPVDLIAGGFPCQDVSLAGRGTGIADGTRSGLWSEMLRIIRDLEPRWVLVENVTGLRSRGLGTVLGELAEGGYDLEWDCIPAVSVGEPHRRDRIFIVAHAPDPRGVGRQGEQPTWPAAWAALGSDRGPGPDAPTEARGRTAEPEPWRDGPGVLRVDDGLPYWLDGPIPPSTTTVRHDRVNRLRCLGNAVVPQVAEWIGRRIMEVEHDA